MIKKIFLLLFCFYLVAPQLLRAECKKSPCVAIIGHPDWKCYTTGISYNIGSGYHPHTNPAANCLIGVTTLPLVKIQVGERWCAFYNLVAFYTFQNGIWLYGGGTADPYGVPIGAISTFNETYGAFANIWLDEGSIETLRELFPNGCADLPSQQPTLTPSPDPGKPECREQQIPID